MEFILAYVLFAVTTSLTSLYELVSPVLAKRRQEGLPTMSVPLLYLTFFVVNTINAPKVFLSCISPAHGELFRKGLYTGLYPKE